ncbi:hypothetical protein K7432_017956 [Basidiobolus ranarum]|uniref:Yeast cell wall synthesis Kre9/Knh1-like N-terminal domain-containing protein n=1 Tax=Basidiobolus ranarum TaxID=34480 RepID=A0ABR2VKR6_9FUNG
MKFISLYAGVIPFLMTIGRVNGDFAITSPTDAKLLAGTLVKITWIETSATPATPATMSAYLLTGTDPTRLQIVANITNSIVGKSGFYDWFILATTRGSKNYVIRMGDGGDARYSHYFEIDNPALPPLPESYENLPKSSPTPNNKAPIPTATIKPDANLSKLVNANQTTSQSVGLSLTLVYSAIFSLLLNHLIN